MMSNFGRAAAAALALSCAPLMAAMPAGDGDSVAIRTADLDLASADGVARLHGRLAAAVRGVCHADADLRDLGRQMEAQRCTRTMRADGEGKIALAAQRARAATLLADARVK